jgi:glutamine synthetase
MTQALTTDALTGDVEQLQERGIKAVRLQYADLHGIARGKDIPTWFFEHALEEGIGFVEAIMTVDLGHNVVAGFEGGFPDLLARPDISTLVELPWEPGVAAVICDLEDPVARAPHLFDSRGALKRALAEFEELGLEPIIGPELEFYLLEPDPSDPRGFRPYAGENSPV